MIRNLSLALIVSLALTFIGTVLYIFYPVLKLILGQLFGAASNADSSGMAAVTGGVSATVLPVALLAAVILFFIIFTLLQRRSG
ncbi:MAG TPA: hypothetical protein VFR78_09185 [Pyrinomonadaceae bacterium]|nr:hypothetical protein [Pyrinomonadaceae bacterium]